MLGQVAGTQVDAVCVLSCVGYRTIYPSRLPNLPYYGQELGTEHADAARNVWYWRWGKTVSSLIESGHDPMEILCREARRLGIDIWADMHMNDWHHWDEKVDAEGQDVHRQVQFLASPFFIDHPEYQIGREAVINAPAEKTYTSQTVQFFWDYARHEVREFRRAIIEEVCTRYDVDGFQMDLMRIPCFFKPAEIEKNTPLMTAFIRDVRATLDRIGEKRGECWDWRLGSP